MAKRLKYFNEVQIMRNNMELVKDTNGSVSVTPEEVTVQDRGTFVITYTVGDDPIHIGGVLRFTIPFGFTKPQICDCKNHESKRLSKNLYRRE